MDSQGPTRGGARLICQRSYRLNECFFVRQTVVFICSLGLVDLQLPSVWDCSICLSAAYICTFDPNLTVCLRLSDFVSAKMNYLAGLISTDVL